MLSSDLQANSWSAFPVSTHFGIIFHRFQPLRFHGEHPVTVSDALRSYTNTLRRMRISAGVLPDFERAGADPWFFPLYRGGGYVAEGHGVSWSLHDIAVSDMKEKNSRRYCLYGLLLLLHKPSPFR